ncbi:MAG: LysM peptidoglycan-binding domain-containing protein [Anaerolinea sp.]|nr:LysM peptidoglycan-binding domain-containing protein [Anaerolinea sp.]
MNGWLVLGIILILVAGTVVYRLNPKNPIDGAVRVTGFVVTFLMIFALMGMPAAWLVRSTPAYMQSSWGWAVGGGGVKLTDLLSGSGVGADLIAPIATATPTVTPGAISTPESADPTPAVGSGVRQHTVKAGETLAVIARNYSVAVDEIVATNGIADPNRIAVGQVLTIPGSQPDIAPASGGGAPDAEANVTEANVTPSPSPSPTATADFTAVFAEIEQAKRDGDLKTGQARVIHILNHDPGNVRALAYQQEINAAGELAQLWAQLGDQLNGGFVYGWDDMVGLDGRDVKAQEYVARMMYGHSFQIIEVERAWMRGYFGESVQLRCTSDGWMKGQEISVQRYMIRKIAGKDDTGYSFYVGQ